MTVPYDPQHLVAMPPRVTVRQHSRRDTMLYALGVGAGHSGEEQDLPFIYEAGLQALPTMAVVLATPGFWQMEPQYGLDWKRLLHGEQSLVIERPLPVEGEVRSELTIEAIVDKGAGRGAVLASRRTLFDHASGELLATLRQTSFLRGEGGKGGTQASAPSPHPVPDRAPDIETTAATRREQALIYRLSGDYNPLHVDPAVAREGGLPRPILHGLCTYGIAGRVLLGQLCGRDPARLKRLDVRFTAPVLPGDELVFSIWREAPGKAAFRVAVPAREVTVINNGYVEYQD